MRVLTFAFLILPIVSGVHISDLINSLNTTFKAQYYPELDGIQIGSPIKANLPSKSKNYHDFSNNGFDSYDVSDAWPRCKAVFEDFQSQGNCSSSWAISVASAIRDRRCIEYKVSGTISAYDLVSCCSNCQTDGKNGCNGGDHHSAFQYFADQGLVTGGSFGSKIGCKPYPINPDRNVDKPASTKCQKSCQPSYDKRNYLADKTRGGSQVYLSRNNKAVMNEIIDRGPVVAEFAFGVYQHTTGKLHGYYYARILGWGRDKETGVEYWKAAASFGKNWGEGGTFRIERGSDESGFEANIIGADLRCSKIKAYYNGTFRDPRTGVSFPTQYQITSDINLNDKRVYLNLDGFYKGYSEYYLFGLVSQSYKNSFGTDKAKNTSIPFDKLSSLEMTIRSQKSTYVATFIDMPISNNTFLLNSAIRNCSTSLGYNNPDMTYNLYNSCFCCGDSYNPDATLECLPSPWD